jgi:tetratricopeptide (TPR) repeat protein
MRKINAKLFLGLLIGAAVLTGTVFATHHFQYQRVARAVLWQARRAQEQGQAEREARYLMRYLEFNPRDDAEKARLARVWAGDAFAGQPRVRTKAMRLLDEVLKNEDRPDLRRLLVQVCLDPNLRNYKLAREHLEVLLPWQEVQALAGQGRAPAADKERGELEGFWGLLLEGEGNHAPALLAYRLAVRHAPEEQANYVRLAYLLRRHKEADPDKRLQNRRDADQVLDALVRHNEPSYRAFLARWRYRRDFDLLDFKGQGAEGKVTLKEAAEDVAQALKRTPDKVLESEPEAAGVLLAAADLERLLAQNDVEDLDRPAPEREKKYQEHRDQAYRYLQRGLALRGNAVPAAGIDSAPFQLLWHKANLLLDDIKRLDVRTPQERERLEGQKRAWEAEVAQAIEQVRKTRVAAAAEYLEGRLLLHERRWAEAAARFEHARESLAPQPDLAAQAGLYLGQCYEQLEEPAQMYDAYHKVLAWNPDTVPALLGQATALWAQGRLNEAMESYRRVITQKLVPARAWLDIARLEAQRQLQEDKPEWGEAEEALRRAEKALKDVPDAAVEVTLLRADVLVARGLWDEAKGLLEKARAKRPKEAALWAALADLARTRQQQPERVRQQRAEARAVLDEAEKELGGTQVLLLLARARLLADAKDQDGLTRLSAKAGGLKEEDRGRLLNGLAAAQYRAGNNEEAYRLWGELARLPRYRSDLRLRLLLFDLALKRGDEAGMQRALDDIRAVERSSGAFHRYGQALRLIALAKKDPANRGRHLDEARVQVDRVLADRPTWPPVFLARAEISELSGNPEQAINDLKEAQKNGETSPSVIRRLADLLAQRQRYEEANVVLDKLRGALMRNADLGRLAANVALGRQETSRAVELARSAVRDDASDPRDMVWLGRVLAAAGQKAEAELKFKRAIELGPREPEPWVAMVQFLAGLKRVKAAAAVIQKAKAKLAPEKAPLALAQCHEALGETERAREYYEKALGARPNDVAVLRGVATFYLKGGRLPEAEPLLKKVVAGAVEASSGDVEWARRGLAIVLAASTDYGRFREALGLVGLKLDERGRLVRDAALERADSTEAKRAKARVLATQAQRQFRLRAIELLEELARSQALSPDDQFILALLYEGEGSWAKARAMLQPLVLPQTHTPQYLAQYAHGLLRQGKPGDVEEAGRWIDRLAELEKQREVEPNTFGSVELKARWLEADGKGDAALALLRGHVRRPKARAEEVLLVLASLLRQKRFDDAFALSEEAWREKKCPPEAAGGVSVALLRGMKPTDAQARQVEDWLKAAIAEKPGNVALRMHLADMYDLRGRYAESEKAYREVLKQEPNNVVALNNLAWLLAQRSGDAAEAERLINAAVNGLGRRADLLDTRGLVHLALGRPEQAVADLKEATADAPTPTRLFHLARAHQQARDRDSAVKALREAQKQGLKPDALHPVEQEACRKLLAELDAP